MSRNINAELARPLWSWSAKARRAGGALLAKAKYPLCGVRSCWGVSVSVSRAEWGMSGSAVGRGPGASLQRVLKLLFRWGVNNQRASAPPERCPSAEEVVSYLELQKMSVVRKSSFTFRHLARRDLFICLGTSAAAQGCDLGAFIRLIPISGKITENLRPNGSDMHNAVRLIHTL